MDSYLGREKVYDILNCESCEVIVILIFVELVFKQVVQV